MLISLDEAPRDNFRPEILLVAHLILWQLLSCISSGSASRRFGRILDFPRSIRENK